MFFINWYERWTKLYILSNHFKESTGLFMCILGLNSPGFKFHLTTKVVIAIIQSEATLPRKSLLCQVWSIFVNGFVLVWWYFQKILSVSHCSQKGHCFVIYQGTIYYKSPLSLSPHSNPPPPTFVPASCWQSFVVKLEWMNYLWIIHLCIWNVFGVISIK